MIFIVRYSQNFIRHWLFPIIIGVIYWLFDTVVDYLNPGIVPKETVTLLQAFSLDIHSIDGVFRLLMTGLSIAGASLFERTMKKIQRLENLLYLNEFAVERTRAFAMMWTDETGKLIKVNQYAAERLGYTKAELLSRTIFDITPSHTLEAWQRLLEKLKEKNNLIYATTQRKKDGTSIDAIVYLQYLKTSTDQYQFAFVCDAVHCPVVRPGIDETPCGRSPLPTFEKLLGA